MQPDRIDPHLPGKIALARFLELPVGKFHRVVAEADASIGQMGLEPWVSITRLANAQTEETVVDVVSDEAVESVGQVYEARAHAGLRYFRESYIREYRFDQQGIQHLMSQPEFSPVQSGALRRLGLINSRNRLTHALLQAVLTVQSAYLRSSEPLALVVLTQADVSSRLRSDPTLSVIADEGRISRLVRGLSITLRDGQVLPLTRLFAKPRRTNRYLVQYVVTREKGWMLKGELRAPLTDDAIVEILSREHGVQLSRRTVVNIRRELGILDHRAR